MALELEKRTETALGVRVSYNLEQITRERGCCGCGNGFRRTEKATAAPDKLGVRRARVKHTKAFWAQYPDSQTQHRCVLGSSPTGALLTHTKKKSFKKEYVQSAGAGELHTLQKVNKPAN